jgi:plasmid stabilization system protein ParE
MQILTTELFESQLKTILSAFKKEDPQATKKFKLYLDTIIINMPTKAQKYKKSIYFDDENIRDIPHEDFTILFYIDTKEENYLILAILENESQD